MQVIHSVLYAYRQRVSTSLAAPVSLRAYLPVGGVRGGLLSMTLCLAASDGVVTLFVLILSASQL